MEDFRIEISELTLAARRYGPKNGVPVLALHGWLDNAATFDRLAPLLTWAHVVAIDLPGHGLSDHRPPGATYNMLDWVGDVFEVADALGWNEFVLLGHSMGGAIASLVAGTLPQRIKALMLIDALGPLTATAEEGPARLAAHLLAAARLRAKEPPRYESFEAALSARMRAGDFESADAIRGVVDRGLQRVIGESQSIYRWRADGRLTLPSSGRLTREQVAAFLRSISCPVLLVRPVNGLKVFADEIEPLVRAIQHLDVRTPEGYHHVHLDRPEVVANLMNEWRTKHLQTP